MQDDFKIGDLVEISCDVSVLVQKNLRSYLSHPVMDYFKASTEEKAIRPKEVAIILEILNEDQQRLLILGGVYPVNLVKIHWDECQGWISKKYLKLI